MFVGENYDLQNYLPVKIRVGPAQLVGIMASVNLFPVRMATALALKSYPVKRQLKVPGGTLDVQKAVTFFLTIGELENVKEFLLYEDAPLIILGMGAVCTFKLSSGYHRVVYQTLITNRVIEVEMASRKSPFLKLLMRRTSSTTG